MFFLACAAAGYQRVINVVKKENGGVQTSLREGFADDLADCMYKN